MSGLNWVSYNSIPSGNNLTSLYNNTVSFFNSNPVVDNSGSITKLQINGNNANIDTPSLSSFSSDGTTTTNIAIKISGYFCPNVTGDWTIHLGYGIYNTCDDFSVLFLGIPDTTITPVTTFTSEIDQPSSAMPFILNYYGTYPQINSKTAAVKLQAGNKYPILIYYFQGNYGYSLGLGFSLNGGSLITDFTSITSRSLTSTNANTNTNTNANKSFTCFKEGTKILTDNGYKQIETLKKGDLVKTLNDGYKSIFMIGKRNIYHAANTTERIKDQLYKCTHMEYPEIKEDLVITGCHCILVDGFKDDEQRQKTIEVNGKIYVTDRKYRLPICLDERASVYEFPGDYTIYHLALENEDYYMNYGIYANGLVVESCSKRYLKEKSNMTIIE
jgi:hypothetical protein